ncbi:hypothetical protein [Nonomuraea sp. NPDC049695]|uniref:hypothetical protein n=1 Tax=Nonomuraea sp. NPDC049695 TaxID=3154734 RepID=UPI0034398D0D
MAAPWSTPRGSIPLGGVMGLVLLSLLMAGASLGWCGGDPATRSAPVSSQTWGSHALDDGLSSLPPRAGSVREHHVLSLWPPLRGMRHVAAAHLALLPAPAPDGDVIGDPQQFGHRIAGSRGPPLI